MKIKKAKLKQTTSRRMLYLLLIVIVSGCSRQEAKTIDPITASYNGGEENEWTNTYLTKSSDNAHSGKRVAFVDSGAVFSMTYSKSLENISTAKLDSVVFSFWVFIKNEKATGKTVISIDKPDNTKNIIWIGNPIEDKVKEHNKWVHISETFLIPTNIDRKSVMKLYVLNTSKEEILLDDFKVEFY